MKFAVCYNTLHVFKSAKELIEFFALGREWSDGSERDRYTNILMDYMDDPNTEVGYDGDEDNIWEISFHEKGKQSRIKVDHQSSEKAIEGVKSGKFKQMNESFKPVIKEEKEETVEELMNKIEALDWWVERDDYEDEIGLTIGMMSDAGEDFSFTASGKTVEDLKNDIRDYCYNFDIDEHVSIWLEARQNGVAGVPGAVDLVHDAESLSEYLEDLADNLDKPLTEAAKEKGNKIRDFLKYELEDDNTSTGGIEYPGETVEDFMGYVDDLSLDDSVEDLNKVLKSCGIKPIKK